MEQDGKGVKESEREKRIKPTGMTFLGTIK
jgi:hypothetical protein